MIKQPILALTDGTTVKAMYADGTTGSILVSLSDGRILRMDSITMLASLAGDRLLSAQTVDGYGNVSVTGNSTVLYALHNRIMEVNISKEQIRWKEVTEPFSSTSGEKVYGVFTSPVLWGGQDFGFWKGLYWETRCPDGTDVSVYARAGSTQDGTLSSTWFNMVPGSREAENLERASSSSSVCSADSVTLFKSMDMFNNKGGYLQLRLVLGTSSATATPAAARLTATYESKFAVYFFTQKFVMEGGSNAGDIFLTGTYSMPQNTEIRFGVSPGSTTDWNDYSPVNVDSLSKLPAGTSERFKIGIKMSSWDDAAAPSVDEFAVMLGADKDNLLNGGA